MRASRVKWTGSMMSAVPSQLLPTKSTDRNGAAAVDVLAPTVLTARATASAAASREARALSGRFIAAVSRSQNLLPRTVNRAGSGKSKNGGTTARREQHASASLEQEARAAVQAHQ